MVKFSEKVSQQEKPMHDLQTDTLLPNNSSNDSKSLQFLILIFGAIEIAIGLLSYMFADYFDFFISLSFIAGIAGIFALVFSVIQPASIKIYDVLAMALMMAYGIGTLNTLISFMLENSVSVLSYYVSEAWLSRTLGSVMAASGLLHVFGRLDNDGYIFKQFEIKDTLEKRIFFFVALIMCLLVYQMARGSIGFMASLTISEGSAQISSLATIVSSMITPVGCLAVYTALKRQDSKNRLKLLVIAALMLGVQFFLGRRIFIFSAGLYAMTALFAYRPKRLLSLKTVCMLVMAVFVIQVATTAFYTVRLASWSLGGVHKGKPKIQELLPEAYKIYMEGDKDDISQKIKENIKTRTFVLEYLAMLSQRESESEPMYGENLARALVVATPSLFYPNKYKNPLFTQEESLANPHFGLPDWDAANTVLTAGVIDFGLLGIFLLPIFFCVIYSLLLRLSFSKLPKAASFVIALLVCQIMLSVENDVVGYISSIRTLLVVMLFTLLVFTFKKKFLVYN